MTCREFLRRRSALAHKARPASPELREHLAACSECSRLEDWLGMEDSATSDLGGVTARIEKAIAADLTPIEPLPSLEWHIAVLSFIAFLVAGLIGWGLGLHGWEEMSSKQAAVTFGLLPVLIVTAASAVSRQMTPGAMQRLSPALPFGVCLFAMPFTAVLLYSSTPNPDFAFYAARCWAIGMACAIGTAPILWLVLRRGFALQPRLHAASAGLLAGLAGIAVLELQCPLMDASHKLAGHATVVFTAALIGYVLTLVRTPARAEV